MYQQQPSATVPPFSFQDRKAVWFWERISIQFWRFRAQAVCPPPRLTSMFIARGAARFYAVRRKGEERSYCVT